MKRIVGWLEQYLPRSKSLDLPDAPDESGTATADEIDLGIDLPKEIPKSATDAPTPAVHADEYVNTVPNLKIVDELPPDTDESTGFNPYDTGTLQTK